MIKNMSYAEVATIVSNCRTPVGHLSHCVCEKGQAVKLSKVFNEQHILELDFSQDTSDIIHQLEEFIFEQCIDNLVFTDTCEGRYAGTLMAAVWDFQWEDFSQSYYSFQIDNDLYKRVYSHLCLYK